MVSRVMNNPSSKGLYAYATEAGFQFGTVLSYDRNDNEGFFDFAAKHAQTITAENEMKSYRLLDQEASKADPDGMPAMDFTNADKTAEWAQSHGKKIHGHTLVYHYRMPEWFFREGYESDTPFVSRDAASRRLEGYIDRVIRHFEEKYPGLVCCWDVVNEAIGKEPWDHDPEDPRAIRVLREDERNIFLDRVGPDYIEKSFLYARNTVDALGADIRLFLNDYNSTQPKAMRDLLYNAEIINSYAKAPDGAFRKLMDGMGIESYVGGYGTQKGCLDDRSIINTRKAIMNYADLGLEVQLTELTIRNFEAELEDQHAEFCARFFQMLRGINQERPGTLTGVTMWGLVDYPCVNEKLRYNWNPHGGLLTADFKPKKAFYSIMESLKA